MKIRIKCKQIITKNAVIDGYVYIEDGKITDVSRIEKACDESLDYSDCILAPGFVEIHCHGGAGGDFLSESAESVLKACDFHLSHGATSICPTISTAPFKTMRAAVAAIAEAKKSARSKINIVGSHLEGPYLSLAQTGAQSPDSITEPKREEYEALIKEYGDTIARWSYAPERDDGSFAKFLRENGILLSAGHTDATYPDMKRGMENGLKLVTHLYSCTSTITRVGGFRRLGVIESAYLEDDMFVELIADGKHLPHDLLRLILKIKTPKRVVLVSDCLALTGTGTTEGVMSGVEFIVEDGVCKLRDRTAFAGSIATSEVLFRTALEVGCSLTDAALMTSTNPASLLGLNKGEIKAGFDADLTVLDREGYNVRAVFVAGEKVRG
ncbi:MAG: N-acetylglucosamine-6-phosphate deacetylase [Clostridia bacterium]|nr:N-acetylglucosamine-6-phosphate deacetylase [Clostridia bacterium]